MTFTVSRKKRTHRRTVAVCKHTQYTTRGGPTKLWAFSYDDLAALFGVHRDTVRNRIRAGVLDPTDMRSIGAELDRSRAERDEVSPAVIAVTVYVAAATAEYAAAVTWVLEHMPGCAPIVMPVDSAAASKVARMLARGCDRTVVWDDPKLAARDDVTGRVVVLVDAAMREAVAAGASPWETRWRLANSLRAFAYEDRDRADG